MFYFINLKVLNEDFPKLSQTQYIIDRFSYSGQFSVCGFVWVILYFMHNTVSLPAHTFLHQL